MQSYQTMQQYNKEYMHYNASYLKKSEMESTAI